MELRIDGRDDSNVQMTQLKWNMEIGMCDRPGFVPHNSLALPTVFLLGSKESLGPSHALAHKSSSDIPLAVATSA